MARQPELMTQDFFELVCRNRAKEKKNFKMNLPSLMFYAEPEEVKREEDLIRRMIDNQFKFPKIENNHKKSIWAKPRESQFFNANLSPKQKRSSITNTFRYNLLTSRTPDAFDLKRNFYSP